MPASRTKLSEGYLLSDTIVWMAPQHAANMAASPMISLQRLYTLVRLDYFATISDQTLSLTLLVAFIVCGLFFEYRVGEMSNRPEQNEAIAFGDLTST